MLRLLISLTIFTLASSSVANNTEKKFYPDHIDTSFNLDYYNTTSNFDSSGKSAYALPGGNSLQYISGIYFLRWVITPQWGIWTEIKGRQTTSTNNIGTATKRINRGLTNITIGGDLFILNKPFRLIGDFSLLYPFQTIDIDTAKEDQAPLGEGAMEIRGQLIAQQNISKSWQFHQVLGFQYRNEQRSSLLPWELGLKWNLGAFKIGFDILGFFSIINDSSPTGKRKRVTDKVSGKSFKFFSEDPSSTSYSINTSLKINRSLQLTSSFYQEILGTNYAKGYGIITGLQYTHRKLKRKKFKDKEVRKAYRRLKRKQKRNKNILNEFEEDLTIDNYDDSLFEDE